ncbi:MAG: hypothetical protein JXB45_07070 [Candidatus Krumholzibacteriota bacterium]|nr:hypothetical protein [Candidatus Krumholzibacteriota bacterium]
MLLFSQLPGSFVFFVGVGPEEIEEDLVGVSFFHEITDIFEVFQFIELYLYQIMGSFDVRLEGVGAGGDGIVDLAVYILNG